ncbi:MAG: histidine phosphatase family protein [archaeon]
MKIYITRHGETLGNVNRIHEGGERPGELSDLGKKQIKKLALRLKNEKFDCIYSSNLKRAKDTANAIAKYHPKIPVIFIEDLRERDLGDFTGKHYDSVDWNNSPKNLETDEQVNKRCLKFISKIYHLHKDKTILIVAHGFFNKYFISSLLDGQVSPSIISQKNTCVNILEINEDKKHVVHLLNCTKHLENTK